MQKDHGSAQKTHLCKICKKGFGGYELLKDHKYQAHSQVNCPQCSKILFNRMELRKHQATEHGITEGVFCCNICPKEVFLLKYHYKKHMVEKHAIELDEKDD
jgi:DNA-directed RNA polymerase subunit RPC12/RpoP